MNDIKAVTVRMPQEKIDALKQISKKTGISVGSMMRNAGYKLIEEHKAKTQPQ